MARFAPLLPICAGMFLGALIQLVLIPVLVAIITRGPA